VASRTFQPNRVRLARELRGWTQGYLAGKAGLSAAAISQFEAGSTPTEANLEKLGEVLDLPLGFFFVSVTDTHEGFFRSLRRTSVADRRRARAHAHLAHDLAEAAAGDFPNVDIPDLPAPDLDPKSDWPTQAAQTVRRQWGIGPGPIPDVIASLEDHGILVLRLALDSIDVDAFSLPFDDRPVVVLSSDKNDRARSRFDAAHELGHLVMHGLRVWGVKEVEQQAHTFAAEFLMPAAEIMSELPHKVDWSSLFALKVRWQVSLAALLMRAKTLEVISPNEYLSAVKYASARGWRRLEPVQLDAPEQPSRTQRLVSSAAAHRATRDWFPQGVWSDLLASTGSR
jgi:Zn-dependent peptidase ImmA (M78 family)/transcriptional regulator with XRE-family HTH domain